MVIESETFAIGFGESIIELELVRCSCHQIARGMGADIAHCSPLVWVNFGGW